MAEIPKIKRSLMAAAICGLDGSIWAKSGEFPDITDEQMTDIVDSLVKPEVEKKI